MSSAQLPAGVAVRISALCLTGTGVLADRLMCDHAVRAALLLDLALCGLLESEDDAIVVDGRPTGFLPADRLLAAIAAEPERSLDGRLGERRVGRLEDVASANVASGRWRMARGGPLGLGRRYVDLHRAATEADRRRAAEPPTDGCSPAEACVSAVATAAGVLDLEVMFSEEPPEQVAAATGPAAWLCRPVVDHLRSTWRRYASQLPVFGPF
jgi:hypothetical protein